MARDILKEIVDRRIEDMQRLGIDFGCNVPSERQRAIHSFIDTKGAILEIKRASPSKGDIAPGLDAAQTAVQYAKAGAAAISCLTETNYFKGTLTDFMAAAGALDKYEAEGHKIPALLRKDFLINSQEVEVAYRAGADAVLLIARILTKETMLDMAKTAEKLGISVLIEVRKAEDLEKLAYVMEQVNHKNILCGVNSRDLKDFTIDMLIPASMIKKIRCIASDARVTFESGILSPESAAFAGSMDFSAILLGEAAAKNPEKAFEFTKAFEETSSNENGKRWVEYASKIEDRQGRPFVKICGITNIEDAMAAAELGADYLGFILWPKSKRCTNDSFIRQCYETLKNQFGGKAPKLIGVVVDSDVKEYQMAISLAKEGILDAIQLHTIKAAKEFISNPELRKLPHYCAVNIKSEEDIKDVDFLNDHGEPRVLIDAQTANEIGGTGKTIDENLVKVVQKKYKLWLAGGINSENVYKIIQEYKPELIDISSSVEKEPGIKDKEKLNQLFKAINN